MFSYMQAGVYKVASPPPPLRGNRIKLLGKKIKWGRSEGEGKRKEGKGRGKRMEGKGKARGKRREMAGIREVKEK